MDKAWMVWVAGVLIGAAVLWRCSVAYRARRERGLEMEIEEEIADLRERLASLSPEDPLYQALTNRILFLEVRKL